MVMSYLIRFQQLNASKVDFFSELLTALQIYLCSMMILEVEGLCNAILCLLMKCMS